MIRVDTYMNGKDLASRTEDAYRQARYLTVDESRLLYCRGTNSLDYFMGLAYLRAHEFQKACDMFASVLKKATGQMAGLC